MRRDLTPDEGKAFVDALFMALGTDARVDAVLATIADNGLGLFKTTTTTKGTK